MREIRDQLLKLNRTQRGNEIIRMRREGELSDSQLSGLLQESGALGMSDDDVQRVYNELDVDAAPDSFTQIRTPRRGNATARSCLIWTVVFLILFVLYVVVSVMAR